MNERIQHLDQYFTELQSLAKKSKSRALAKDMAAAGHFAEESLATLERIKADLPFKERESWVALRVEELEKAVQMMDARLS